MQFMYDFFEGLFSHLMCFLDAGFGFGFLRMLIHIL
jgi:hypothetical protein